MPVLSSLVVSQLLSLDICKLVLVLLPDLLVLAPG